MIDILAGCGQITWRNVPETQVLAEIVQAGYAGAPARPVAQRSAAETLEFFGGYGLRPAPGYFSANFWNEEQRPAILEQAGHYARFMRAVGCTELYVAAGGFDYVTSSGHTRRQRAGHVRSQDALSDPQFERCAAVLDEVGRITLQEGVRSCFHNHVGSAIESAEEIGRLLALTDHDLIYLGPDTGHLAWAGIDVVAFIREHAGRIKTVHLKDIDEAVRQRGHAGQWDYDTFTRSGIFTELGEECVDFPAVMRILSAAGFAGWVIVETDVTQKPTALESAAISRTYLRSIGV